MALNFPATPSNGQIYKDKYTGVNYIYYSNFSYWKYYTTPVLNASLTNQIIFDDNDTANGSNGMTFSKTSNTATFNNIAVVQNVTATYFYGNGSSLTGIANDLTPANNYAGLMANSKLANVTAGAPMTITWATTVATGNTVATINMGASGVTSATYGAASGQIVPRVNVDSYGRIISAANVNIDYIPANNYAGLMANSKLANVASGTGLTATFVTTAGTGNTVATLTLATSGVTAATYGAASGLIVPTVNVDTYGRVISASNVNIDHTPANNFCGALANVKLANVVASSPLAATFATSVGNTTATLSLSTSGVAATTYGGTTQIPAIVVDTYGRITSASNVAFSGGSTITNETASASTYYPVFTSITSGTMSTANIATTDLTFVPSTGTLSAVIFNSLSDANRKTDIETLDNGLELLGAIRPVSFKWKDTGEKSYGVIAQELEQILPELVVTNDNGLKTVSYMPMIAMLIDVVKKQQTEIDEIKKQLNKEKE